MRVPRHTEGSLSAATEMLTTTIDDALIRTGRSRCRGLFQPLGLPGGDGREGESKPGDVFLEPASAVVGACRVLRKSERAS